MSVWILTFSPDDYQHTRLAEEFASVNLNVDFRRISKLDVIINKKDPTIISYDKNDVELPTIVLTRFGSNHPVTVPRYYEYLGIPVINATKGMLTARDKFHMHLRLFNQGIQTPKTMLFSSYPINIDFVESEIGFPCVIKPNPGSYGNGTHLCRTRQAFIDHFDMLHAIEVKKSLLIQELIPDRAGCDLRVFVVGDKALGAMERISPRSDDIRVLAQGVFGPRANYPMSDEIADIAVRAVKAVGLEIAGVDLLFSNTGFKVCEVNVCPGFQTFEENCGINVAKAIVDYVISKM